MAVRPGGSLFQNRHSLVEADAPVAIGKEKPHLPRRAPGEALRRGWLLLVVYCLCSVGAIKFSKDLKVKKHIINTNDLVHPVYKKPNNPTLEIFSIDRDPVKIADLSGQPPRYMNFSSDLFLAPGVL